MAVIGFCCIRLPSVIRVLSATSLRDASGLCVGRDSCGSEELTQTLTADFQSGGLFLGIRALLLSFPAISNQLMINS